MVDVLPSVEQLVRFFLEWQRGRYEPGGHLAVPVPHPIFTSHICRTLAFTLIHIWPDFYYPTLYLSQPLPVFIILDFKFLTYKIQVETLRCRSILCFQYKRKENNTLTKEYTSTPYAYLNNDYTHMHTRLSLKS